MPNPRDADLPARITRAMAYVARWCQRRLAEACWTRTTTAGPWTPC